MSDKSLAANSIIKNHVVWSMGAGFIPIPFADLLAVTGIQLDMIRQMCNLYGVDFKDTRGKAIVSALTSSTAARMGAQAVKFIPGIGSLIGGVTMSVLSGASTYAVGHVFLTHFELGGTLLDFDIERLKKMYDEWFEKGKAYAEKIRNEEKEKNGTEEAEVIEPDNGGAESLVERLKDLADLKESGAITKTEYDKLKKNLMSELG